MRYTLALALALCLMATVFVDAAGNKKNKKNKKAAQCKAQENALKMAGFELCKAKTSRVAEMLDHAEELDCFRWIKDATISYMKDMAEMARNESRAIDEREERKNRKKNKKNNDVDFWDIDLDELDIIDFIEEIGLEEGDLENMPMRMIIDMLGNCRNCKKDGCLRMNHWLSTKMALVNGIFEAIEMIGGCPDWSTSRQPMSTTASMLPGK